MGSQNIPLEIISSKVNLGGGVGGSRLHRPKLGGGVVCKVIVMSNPTKVMLG